MCTLELGGMRPIEGGRVGGKMDLFEDGFPIEHWDVRLLFAILVYQRVSTIDLYDYMVASCKDQFRLCHQSGAGFLGE